MPDMSYVAKELCRGMHAPCAGDLKVIDRVVKYVASEPRLVYWYVLFGSRLVLSTPTVTQTLQDVR